MGGVLSKIGGVFNPTISGTGQTARDLTKIGYSQEDLAKMDPRRAMLKGVLAGGLKTLQGAPQTSQAGPGMIDQAPMMSPVDSGYFRPTDFSASLQRNPIYG